MNLKRALVAIAAVALLSTELSAFWVRSPSRSNPNDPRSAAFSGGGGTAASDPSLKITVQTDLGAPVANAAVQLGSDSAGSVVTDSLGVAYFPTVTLPIDVHLFTPLSAGLPVYQPAIISFFGVNERQPTIKAWATPGPGGSPDSVTFCYLGTSNSAEVEAFQRISEADYSGGGGGSGPNACTVGMSGHLAGNHYNCSFFGYDTGNSITCAWFEPKFTAVAGPDNRTRTALTTGYSTHYPALSVTAPETWPNYNVTYEAGNSATDCWTVAHFQTPSASAILPLAIPTTAAYYEYSIYASGTIGGQSCIVGTWPKNTGAPGPTLSATLPGALNFSGGLYSSSNPSLTVNNPSGFNGNFWRVQYYCVGAQWLGFKYSNAGTTETLVRPTSFPPGYGSNIVPAAGVTVTSSVSLSKESFTQLPFDLTFYLRSDAYSSVYQTGTW
jgi:hypothetical protein